MWISDDEWDRIQSMVPIACVDFVPIQRAPDGQVRRVGLIRRRYPDGREVWCHLGGRIRYGETVASALQRHCDTTIDVQPNDVQSIDVQPNDVQPNESDTAESDAAQRNRDGSARSVRFGLRERPVLSEWFPADVHPGTSEPGTSEPGTPEPATSQPTTPFLYGVDPRKHSVSVAFTAEIDDDVTVTAHDGRHSEALAFSWFAPEALDALDTWPGSRELIGRVLAAATIPQGML